MPQFTDDTPFRPGHGHILDKPVMEGRGVEDQDTVSSTELMELTGATFRQIDYWCSQGYIHPVGKNNPGPGKHRRFDKSLVDKIKLVVKISNAFDRKNSPMKYIVEHYEDGEFDMGDGVYLTWDVIEIERDVK